MKERRTFQVIGKTFLFQTVEELSSYETFALGILYWSAVIVSILVIL